MAGVQPGQDSLLAVAVTDEIMTLQCRCYIILYDIREIIKT
jgi:hypothetical protein